MRPDEAATSSPRARHVLFVHQADGPMGGAEQYLHLLGRGLRRAGVTTSILVVGDPRWSRTFAEQCGWAAGVERHPGRASPGALRSALRGQPVDVIHWNFADPFNFEGAALTLLPRSRPSVATDHLPMLRARWPREMTRALANRRLARVIVVGQQSLAAARAHWPRDPGRFVVVRNGVELPEPPTEARPSGTPVRLLFVGRLEDQKDPLLAIDAAGQLHAEGTPCQLTMVGLGSLEQQARRRAETLHVPVEFAGQLDDVDAPMRSADVLCAPSRFEGLPFVPLEALVRGLPVVGSDIPPHRELSQLTPAVTIAAGRSPAAWAGALKTAAEHRAELSAAALAAAPELGADRMVEATRRVYDDAVAGKPLSP